MALYVNGEKVCISKKVTSASGVGIPKTLTNGVLTPSTTFSLPTGASDLAPKVLYEAFARTPITSVNFSSLIRITGYQALSSTFSSCTSLTSVDFSSLTTVTGDWALEFAFSSCTSLSSISFPVLQTIGLNSSSGSCGEFNGTFNNCTRLTSLSFPELTEIYSTSYYDEYSFTFALNNKVQKMYFPKLHTITYGQGASDQDGAKNVFYGCSSLTELHFGVANQAAIEASPGYSTAWGRGAGNVTIYFDL